ncbi:hypothetical protein ACFO4O_12630 [Glaciecola siphonariae]|uniref:Sulfotransferase family protein n=1 Tax=Glaciecola siphonariae TaxID=521012 RepID=A0ABV9LYP4_9ALTE
MSVFYLCTGFHRSGTSLLAQTLQHNGVNMGGDLMGATYSNPLGHIEDMPVVRLHDKVYKLNGADWRYHDSSPLIKPVWLPNYIQSYMQKRKDESSTEDEILGVKDPRAVHFLKDWQVASDGKVRYIFIFRHWREACFSLLKRHSRQFLNTANPMERSSLHLSFWRQHDLAFKMYKSANKRILDFYTANKDKAILLSQEGFVALAQQADTHAFAKCASKIGLDTHYFNAQTLQADLLTQQLPPYAENGIDQNLVKELDALYERLNNAADIKHCLSINEIQTRISPSAYALPKHLALALGDDKQSLESGGNDAINGASSPIDNIFANAEFDFTELKWAEFSGALLRLPIPRISPKPFYAALTCDLDFSGNDSEVKPVTERTGEDYYSLAKVAHYKGVWLVAYLFQMRAMLCDAFVKGHALWDVGAWTMFADEQPGWLHVNDSELLGNNPFKLQKAHHLHERQIEAVPHYLDIAHLSSEDLFIAETEAGTQGGLDACATFRLSIDETHTWLITNAGQNAPEDNARMYMQIAKQCTNNMEVQEFCYIKALRAAHLIADAGTQRATVQQCLALLAALYVKNNMFNYAKATFNALGAAENEDVCEDTQKPVFKALHFLVQEHHFSLYAECLNTVTGKLNNARKAELQKELAQQKALLRPALGLKHRFALLPCNLSYENILLIGKENPERSIKLDLLNRRLNFLAKDNMQWLMEGTHGLPTNAKYALYQLISKHWQKLWPEEVYQYAFHEAPSVSASLQKNTRVDKNTHVNKNNIEATSVYTLLVFISDLDSFTAFLALLAASNTLTNTVSNAAPSTINNTSTSDSTLQLHCKLMPSASKLKESVEDTLSQFNVSAYMVDTLPPQRVHESVKREILAFSEPSENRPAEPTHNKFVGVTFCERQSSHIQRVKQITNWYCMLGFEFSVSAMLSNTQADMVVPNYHPSELHSIQDKPLFYPHMYSAWFKQTLTKHCSSIQAPGIEIFWRKFLMEIKKQQAIVKMSNQACEGLFENSHSDD